MTTSRIEFVSIVRRCSPEEILNSRGNMLARGGWFRYLDAALSPNALESRKG